MKHELWRDLISKYRSDQRMTQSALAEVLGMSKQGISAWENGRSCPNINEVFEIAAKLNISTERLLRMNLDQDIANGDISTLAVQASCSEMISKDIPQKNRVLLKALEMYSTGRISKEAFIELIMADE